MNLKSNTINFNIISKFSQIPLKMIYRGEGFYDLVDFVSIVFDTDYNYWYIQVHVLVPEIVLVLMAE